MKNIPKLNISYWALMLICTIMGNNISKPTGLNLGNIYTNVALAISFMMIFLMNSSSEKSLQPNLK